MNYLIYLFQLTKKISLRSYWTDSAVSIVAEDWASCKILFNFSAAHSRLCLWKVFSPSSIGNHFYFRIIFKQCKSSSSWVYATKNWFGKNKKRITWISYTNRRVYVLGENLFLLVFRFFNWCYGFRLSWSFHLWNFHFWCNTRFTLCLFYTD